LIDDFGTALSAKTDKLFVHTFVVAESTHIISDNFVDVCVKTLSPLSMSLFSVLSTSKIEQAPLSSLNIAVSDRD
jgi:hypothetical protein